MSEKEKESIQTICDVYKALPDYLKGKLDGYAEAIKQGRTGEPVGTDQGDKRNNSSEVRT